MEITRVEQVQPGDIVDHEIVGIALIRSKREEGSFVVLDLAIHAHADCPVATIRVPVGTEMTAAVSH